MNNESNALSDLFAACWNDAALKERFMQDPKAVMAEHGIDVPEGMDVNIVENSDTCMNITMPAPPSSPLPSMTMNSRWLPADSTRRSTRTASTSATSNAFEALQGAADKEDRASGVSEPTESNRIRHEPLRPEWLVS